MGLCRPYSPTGLDLSPGSRVPNENAYLDRVLTGRLFKLPQFSVEEFVHHPLNGNRGGMIPRK